MTEPVYDDPDKCVKDDENGIGPCMCPECMEEAITQKSSYIPKGVVLTDSNMCGTEASERVAYHFTCGICGQENIADYMSYCPDCGIRVIIRSYKVMEFIQNYRIHNIKKQAD
jgi:predicted RNA-binding Zn-ribbon protein involved in translation (DUF1610 family)